MTNRERILKTIAFIESNLKKDITISDIAQEAYCSLFHFVRLFKSMTGLSPKKYLLKRRLTESIDALKNSNAKIGAIALDFQFGSHETFTRSFQKHFGTSPSNVSKGEAIPNHLLVQQVSKEYIFQSKEARNKPPELVEFKSTTLVGLSFFISGNLDKLDLTSQWNTFLRNAHLIKNKTNTEQYYQIQYWSENQGVEGMHFFIGAEVKNLNDVSPEFVIKIIPEGSYLKFIHKGLSRNVGFTYRYIYEEFLPETDYHLAKPFNFEYYGENYISPDHEKSESFLYIPIQK